MDFSPVLRKFPARWTIHLCSLPGEMKRELSAAVVVLFKCQTVAQKIYLVQRCAMPVPAFSLEQRQFRRGKNIVVAVAESQHCMSQNQPQLMADHNHNLGANRRATIMPILETRDCEGCNLEGSPPAQDPSEWMEIGQLEWLIDWLDLYTNFLPQGQPGWPTIVKL